MASDMPGVMMMPMQLFYMRIIMSLPSLSRYWIVPAAIGALFASALGAAACPSASLPGPAFVFAGAEIYSPRAFSTVASGSAALSSCNIPGTRGYANDAATMSLNLSMMDGYELVLDVQSDCDSTLLVNAADGSWEFDDDSGEGLMPRIAIADPSRLNGRVDIWIGSYGGGTCPATITLQTRRVPGLPDEAGDVPMNVAGCPDPSLTGRTLSFNGVQLWSRQSIATTASGGAALGGCNIPIPGTRGYAGAMPSFTLYLSGMEGYRLDLDVDASCDSTMLVRAADGSWHFDDDSNGNLDPALSFDQYWQTNGRVDVWIGSYNGSSCPATLNLETFDVMTPSPLPQPAVGCPDPALPGPWRSYTGAELWSRQSLPVQASGTTQLRDCPLPEGRGYANPAPTHSFDLSGMAGYSLDLAVDADCDSTLLVRTPDAIWHFNDDGAGNLDPLISLAPPTALEGRVDVWVGTYGPTPCAGTLTLETFSGPSTAPPPQPAGSLAGTWRLNANGHSGTLTFTPNGMGWSGQLNLGRQETLQNVWFDPASDRVEFFRPDPNHPQHYVGTVANGEMTGQFNQSGGGYVYNWRAYR